MSFFDRIKGLFGNDAASDAGEGGAVDVEMISCEDALSLVHEYLDGELEDVPASQVRLHFEVCQGCYPHLHLETVFREAVQRAVAGEAAPPELKARVLDLLSQAEGDG